MKLILSILLVFGMIFPVHASKILALVDEDPITDFDVDERILMMQTLSGSNHLSLSKTEILNILIDEKIKTKEASCFILECREKKIFYDVIFSSLGIMYRIKYCTFLWI